MGLASGGPVSHTDIALGNGKVIDLNSQGSDTRSLDVNRRGWAAPLDVSPEALQKAANNIGKIHYGALHGVLPQVCSSYSSRVIGAAQGTPFGGYDPSTQFYNARKEGKT